MCWERRWCRAQNDCLKLWAALVGLAGREEGRFLHGNLHGLGGGQVLGHPNLKTPKQGFQKQELEIKAEVLCWIFRSPYVPQGHESRS